MRSEIAIFVIIYCKNVYRNYQCTEFFILLSISRMNIYIFPILKRLQMMQKLNSCTRSNDLKVHNIVVKHQLSVVFLDKNKTKSLYYRN